VYDAKHDDLVSEHLVKDEIGIAHQRYAANPRTFSHLLKPVPKSANPLANLPNSVMETPRGHRIFATRSERIASNSARARFE
jgi:hypothetical protein